MPPEVIQDHDGTSLCPAGHALEIGVWARVVMESSGDRQAPDGREGRAEQSVMENHNSHINNVL